MLIALGGKEASTLEACVHSKAMCALKTGYYTLW